MNLFRRAMATWGEGPPATTSFFEEIRTALQQTPPFRDSGNAQIWDGHADFWRKSPCPHRMLLVDAITKALEIQRPYWAGCVDAWQERADRDRSHAIDLIGYVLDDFYPRRRKLHRRYAEVVEAVLRIRPVDYAVRGKSLQRTLDRTRRQLTGQLLEAFLQYGPSPPDYPREAIYWAIATIMTAYKLETGELIRITDRIKKRCLKHRRSAE